MKRATTPTHYFTLPFDASAVDRFLLTYTQNDRIVLEKTEEDMSADGNVWSVELTQEETKMFAEGNVYAQIRVLTPTGDALASNPVSFYVSKVFNDEVLT